jgi:hypothetical protein
MRQTAVVALETVLSEGALGKPRASALPLWNALTTQYRIIVLTTSKDFEAASAWLKREHFVNAALVRHQGSLALLPSQWRVHEVTEMLSQGWTIDLYLDGHADAVSGVAKLGITTLLFGPPRAGSWVLEPHEMRPWDEVVDRVEREHAAKET